MNPWMSVACLLAVALGLAVGIWKAGFKEVAKASGLVLAGAASVWFAVVIGMLVSLNQIYGMAYAALENTGWTPSGYLLKAVAGLLTGAGYFVVSALTVSLVTLRFKRFVIVLTAAYCLMCLVLFVASRPEEGQVANKQTGAPLLNYFRNSDGTIEVFSIETRFHPRYPNTPLHPITAEAYREYEKQRDISKNGTPMSWVPFVASSKWVESLKGDLNLWVEGIEANDRFTFLHFACAGRTGHKFSGEGWLLPDQEIYLTDQNGFSYGLIKEDVSYPLKPSEGDEKKMVKVAMRVKPGEFFRYVLVFPAFPVSVTQFAVHHEQFYGLSVELKSVAPVVSDSERLHKQLGGSSVSWLNFKSNPSSVQRIGLVGGAPGQSVSLAVEQVGISRNAVFINLVASSTSYSGERKLFSARSGASRTYLIGEEDEKYRLLGDFGEYQKDAAGPEFRSLGSGPYRFQLAFARLRTGTVKFAFRHWQFEPMDVDISEPQDEPTEK